MKDFMILKILDKFRSLFSKIGVDYYIMRKIIQLKLVMDGRRVPTVFSGNTKKNSEEKSNNFVASLWIYIFMGLILIPFVVLKSSYIYQMGIVFGIILFFVMSSLISDFSSVLLDVKDKSIISIRPVDLKTLRMAKTIHIAIYMMYLTFALVGPSLLVSIFTQGILFFLLYFVFVILIDMFIIVLTSLVYAFILRFFSGEKLKDVINYVQIILSLVIMIGYQFVGRLFDIVDLNVKFVPRWWQYFIIPVWFSAPFEMLKKSDFQMTYIIFTLLAIFVPIIAIIYYIKKMTEFENNLNKLNSNHQNKKIEKKKKESVFLKLICRSKEERIFYRFASDIMKQEREFKLKVYPSLGFSIIFPFIFIFQQLSYRSIEELSQGKSFFFIYSSGIMIPSVIMMMQCSDKYKGAWIYEVLPIHNISAIFKGTIKALISKLFLPIFLLEAIAFTAFYGIRIAPDLILVIINIMIYIALCFMLFDKAYPFSKAYEEMQNSNIGVNLFLMLALAVLGFLHFGLSQIRYGYFIDLVISTIVCIVVWKSAFRILPENTYENSESN